MRGSWLAHLESQYLCFIFGAPPKTKRNKKNLSIWAAKPRSSLRLQHDKEVDQITFTHIYNIYTYISV